MALQNLGERMMKLLQLSRPKRSLQAFATGGSYVSA